MRTFRLIMVPLVVLLSIAGGNLAVSAQNKSNANEIAPANSGATSPQKGVQTAASATQDTPVPRTVLPSQPRPQALTEEAKPWWASVLEKALWPLAWLATLAFVAFNARLRRLFGIAPRIIRKISAGGVEVQINSETVELVQRQLSGSFEELVGSAKKEYERLANIQDVPELLKLAIEENLAHLVASRKIRGTVHVQDVIFPEYLYQLVAYYPSGGGRHRRFSQRYGIIGRSWRSQKSHGTGDAFKDAGDSVEALVENWGMTDSEAHGRVSARPSCLSIVIKHNSVPVGVLFVDSPEKDAFGIDQAARELAVQIENTPSVVRLGEAIAKTLGPLRTAAPSILISDPA